MDLCSQVWRRDEAISVWASAYESSIAFARMVSAQKLGRVLSHLGNLDGMKSLLSHSGESVSHLGIVVSMNSLLSHLVSL